MSFDYHVIRHESLPILIAAIGSQWGNHSMTNLFSDCLDACQGDERRFIRINDFSQAQMSLTDIIMLVQMLSTNHVPGSYLDTHFDDVLVGTDAWVYVARDRISKHLGRHVALFPTQDAALRYAINQLTRGAHTDPARV